MDFSDDITEYDINEGQIIAAPIFDIKKPINLNAYMEIKQNNPLDLSKEYKFIYTDPLTDPSLKPKFAITMPDTSMEPEIIFNDILIVNPNIAAEPNKYVLAEQVDDG